MSHGTKADRRSCILVLGMHRSGTSALTRTLNLLGAALPKTLMAADLNNQTGYWESQAFFRLHDRMLDEAGSNWDDWRAFDEAALPADRRQYYTDEIIRLIGEEFEQSPFFVLKDPRICQMVPLYQGIMKRLDIDLGYVLPVRSPLSVASSLAERNQFTEEFGLLLWLRHTLEAERMTRGQRRVVVSYENMIEDWRPSLERVSKLWGNFTINKERADAIDRYLSADFRHHNRAGSDDPSKREKMSAWATEAYRAMLELERDPANTHAAKVLDDIRARLDAFGGISDALFAEMKKRERQWRAALHHSLDEIAELKARVAGIETEARRQQDDLNRERDEWRTAASRSRQHLERLETMLQTNKLAKLGIGLSGYRRLGCRVFARRIASIITREGPASLLVHMRKFITAEIAGNRNMETIGRDEA